MSIDSDNGGRRLCTNLMPQPNMVTNGDQKSQWYHHDIQIIFLPFHLNFFSTIYLSTNLKGFVLCLSFTHCCFSFQSPFADSFYHHRTSFVSFGLRSCIYKRKSRKWDAIFCETGTV